MILLNLLSHLLDYPQHSVYTHELEIRDIIAEADLDRELKRKLERFLNVYTAMPLLEWQAEYDGLFERGRSLGLWLFEHVHGESRDRGQAMVDLTAKYREAGLEIAERQLPDYIPMFLEFLATQGDDNARLWLREVEHILALLQCRLESRNSPYAALFETLLAVANSELDLTAARKQVANEERDDTRKAIDKEWQEEEVTFGADSLDASCAKSVRKPSESQRKDLEVPLTWVGFNESEAILEGVSK